jgi:hypothetical protein
VQKVLCAGGLVVCERLSNVGTALKVEYGTLRWDCLLGGTCQDSFHAQVSGKAPYLGIPLSSCPSFRHSNIDMKAKPPAVIAQLLSGDDSSLIELVSFATRLSNSLVV